jgi:hypothetical protein
MRWERLLLPAALIISTGCYSYVPTRLESVEPGDHVRLRISAVAADRLEPVRFTTTRDVDGAIVRHENGEVYLDAFIRTVDARGTTAVFTQRINLPDSDVQAVEYRRLDRLKSGAAAAGLGAVLAGAAYVIIHGDLGSTTEYQPVEMRRSPFRLQFSIPR